jgi:hypothetical protein
MRFLRFSAGLVVCAALFVTVSKSRADLITVTVTDGTTTYTNSSSTGDVSLAKFTLDGVTFRGVDAYEIIGPPDSLNFQAGLSGKESSGKTITYTVTDTALATSLPVVGFSTSVGLTGGVTGGTFTGGSTVNSVTGETVTVPFSSSSAESVTSSTTSIPMSSSLTVTLTGTIEGFQSPSATFSSSATNFTVPEPTGVLMGLLGLPCLAGLMYLARRRALVAIGA